MTRLWVFSDLHLDHGLNAHVAPEVPDADVAVVAGDLGGGGLGPSLRWLERYVLPHMPVVFVPGNHEFYGTDMRDEVKNLTIARRSGRLPQDLHVLDCAGADVAGVRFLGATLWTDFRLDGEDDAARAQYDAGYHMNDYRAIRWGLSKLTPDRTLELHQHARGWLTDQLAEPARPEPVVVVTHHAPSPWSVHMRYRDSTINGSFASNLDDLLVSCGPDLWVHGHVHDNFDYVVGETRVLCNPQGYGTENPAFKPGLVIEVEPRPNLRPGGV